MKFAIWLQLDENIGQFAWMAATLNRHEVQGEHKVFS
jgi:hypothetical protein